MPPEVTTASMVSHLETFNRAMAESKVAYTEFVEAGARYDFPGMEEARLRAMALMEAGIDAYVRACRELQAMSRAVGRLP